MLDKWYDYQQQTIEQPERFAQRAAQIDADLAQSILDSVDISMAILDQRGYIRLVNKMWQHRAQLSCSTEQMTRTGIGMNYLEICRQARGLYAKEAAEALAGIEAVLQGKQDSFSLEYPCASPTELSWYLMRVTPLPNRGGVVVAHIDVTDRKKTEQQKDLFVSMASHELQTPITALKGLIQLEKRQRQKKHEPDERLVQMEAQTNRLSKFVTELLNAIKIRAGHKGYADESIDLDGLIAEISEIIRQAHPSHKVIIHGTTRATIRGDHDKITQVFTNLLSNAVKYSPQANQIDIYLERLGGRAQVKIQDYGIGIPKERQCQLFEPFSRVDAAKHRFIAGLGIGLYIVREILTYYGGTISLESEENQGSTFTVSLPLVYES